MSDKIRELKAIFNSFDLKESKENIKSCINRFDDLAKPFKGDPECSVAILWMKNIFFQSCQEFSRAEDMLDDALCLMEKTGKTNFTKWQIKTYLSLGYIHHTQCNFIDAEFFLLKALRLADTKHEFRDFLGEIYAKLADVAIHLNQYAKAKSYVSREKQVMHSAYEKFGITQPDTSVSYAYSLIDYCRIKRIIGLADHTLIPSLEKALDIFTTYTYTKGILRAKLEYAQLHLVLNSTDKALFMIQEIEPAFLEMRMYKETIAAGLLTAKVHKKMLDYGLAEEKLMALVELAREKEMSTALIMSDVYYVKGTICYDTDREAEALELFKASAKIGMLGGVKRYIFRAFDAARLIDKQAAKIILTSDLVYQDESFTKNRLESQVSPFLTGDKKTRLFASTLFVDIAGFSVLMKQSDEKATVHMVDELIDRLCIVIFRNKGYIDKFLGDGFMAIFEHGDKPCSEIALNAIKAATDINRAIHNKSQRFKETYGLQEDISFRMGLSTGEIYALYLGNFIKQEFTYLGNAVNLASKLESTAPLKGLLIDAKTHNLVSKNVVCGQTRVDLPSLGKSTAYEFKRFVHQGPRLKT
ncbi:MAG: adenylate/guanylate cyclase domain-containing protein [Desulfobacterales bacterium]|nr:adenylate/guanylate cyclase domain-containing protein [Desulfobacterales bacterium]